MQKAASLLAYLVVHPPHIFSREVLGELLWPDTESQIARSRLRVALAALRREMEASEESVPGVLRCDRASIGLESDSLSSDVNDLREALQVASRAIGAETQIARLSEAIALYRGPLLFGYYEEWIESDAVHLEDEVIRALRRLTGLLEANGQKERALQIATRGVAIAPLHEELQRDLLRLQVACGDIEGARRYVSRLQESAHGKSGALSDKSLSEFLERIERNAPASTQAAQDLVEVSEQTSRAVTALAAPSLPPQWTRFFGRCRELNTLDSGLNADARLVTLTGPGGSGKTRLAIETARLWDAQHPDAVGFARLDGLDSPGFLFQAIADALGTRMARPVDESPLRGSTLFDRIVQAVADNDFLLVLDNFEHLVEEGAPLLRPLLVRAPRLRLLVTSRQRLNLEGEREIPVAPLPTPLLDAALLALSENESVQLFTDRAALSHPGFTLTKHNERAVAALCTRLDGLPLALELAGARADVLSPSQMLKQLEKRFDLPGERATDARHPSLRAALEWSFELLPPELQNFFARLSVFRGGWTGDACRSVCDEPRAVHFLAQLRGCSLVVGHESGQWMRFRLLETLRLLAHEHLTDAARANLQERHADYFGEFAERAARELGGADSELWVSRLEAESDNLRIALEWTLQNRPQSALKLSVVLSHFWYERSRFEEGGDWLNRALEQFAPDAAGQPRLWAEGLEACARLLIRTSNYAGASERSEAAVAAARELGDLRLLAEAITILGLTTILRADFGRTRIVYDEGIALARRLGDPKLLIPLLHTLIHVLGSLGDWDTVRPLAEEHLQLCRVGESRAALLLALTTMAQTLHAQADPTAALPLVEEALLIAREIGAGWELGRALWVRANIARESGDFAAGRAFYLETLQLLHRLNDPLPFNITLIDAAFALQRKGYNAAATRALGYCAALRDLHQLPLLPMHAPQHQQAVEQLRTLLGDEAFERNWQRGAAMSMVQAIEMLQTEDFDEVR